MVKARIPRSLLQSLFLLLLLLVEVLSQEENFATSTKNAKSPDKNVESSINNVPASPTQDCSEASATVLGEGEDQITAYQTCEDSVSEPCIKDVYLWPEEGFEGIGLQGVTGTESERMDAWFSNETLFPAITNARWWGLRVSFGIRPDGVYFAVQRGDNVKICLLPITAEKIQGLKVVGYGPSRWRDTKPPSGCPYQDSNVLVSTPQNGPTCPAPPTFHSATSKTTIIMAALVVPVVVAAMVILVKLYRKHRSTANENQTINMPASTSVRDTLLRPRQTSGTPAGYINE